MAIVKLHEYHAAFRQCELALGRQFGSKSSYQISHPGCIYIPNACIYTNDGFKRWGGDIDLATDDRLKLISASRLLNRKLYVLPEQVGDDRDHLHTKKVFKYAVIVAWQGKADTTVLYSRIYG